MSRLPKMTGVTVVCARCGSAMRAHKDATRHVCDSCQATLFAAVSAEQKLLQRRVLECHSALAASEQELLTCIRDGLAANDPDMVRMVLTAVTGHLKQFILTPEEEAAAIARGLQPFVTLVALEKGQR